MGTPELLHEAWRVSTGNSFVDGLLRRSLAASASQVPELVPTLRSLELGERAQLDLHIADAKSDSGHETSAAALGEFLQRVAKAVRELAKSGREGLRLRGDLNVLAPSPGSVRVVFVEQEDDRPADARSQSAYLWGLGMERLAETFDLAVSGDDALDGAVTSYSLAAREALKSLGQTVAERGWSVAGTLTDREGSSRSTGLTVHAADRMVDAVRRQPSKIRAVRTLGNLDGWRWSNSTLRFIQDVGGAIDIYVPSEQRPHVAALHAEQGDRPDKFEAKVMLSEALTRSGRGIRRSYSLVSLVKIPDLFEVAGDPPPE